MKRSQLTTPAERVIWQISELRDLGRRLALAGFQAGLHTRDPNQVPPFNPPSERPRQRGRKQKKRNGDAD